MGYTGSAPNQIFQRTDGVRTGSAVNVTADNDGVNNTAALADARENDLAAAINQLWLRNGGNQPSANLPMNTFKFTGMGQGSARTDSLRIDQVQDGDLVFATVGGSANAIELTTTPVCSPVAGMVIGFIASADSTSTATVDLNGTVDALQYAGAALSGGEVQQGQFHQVGFDGTQWQLLNPANIQPLSAKLMAIAALAATDGNIIVGDGATWVAESGATARASLGLTIGTDVQAYDAQLDSLSSASANGVSLVTAADYAAMKALLDLEIGTDVEAYDADILKADVTDTLTVGYNVTEFDAGTKSTGTFTPDPASGNFQKAVNNGAHTLAPPGSSCSIVIQYTNGASAGTITTSGFTKVTGDSFTTTNGHDFMLYIVRNNSFSHLNVVALQ